ncbi:MAG: Holliday junction branch migration protein RuvA [Candidatus Puniceispirillum sp. TMED52]|nr:Holliday junction branch migration protein RuvA [SAR116 cluster bacterium]OUU43471.1 MAG: Holliday junction branch migration protein RuvA [Candidatus Puniceispirillum sp. TMED52]HCP18288.1 Holliday junction branch migration protein RuvA [Alphaproteobacteria bacterium]
MIAILRGRLFALGNTDCVIDVNGVGYQCQMTRRCLERIGQIGDEVTVYVDTSIKDDSITLTGFSDLDVKAAWKLLQTVQGVGMKAALSILSALSPDDVILAIAASDKAMICRADGVGPKLAQRIINELAEKVSELPPSSGGAGLDGSGLGGAGLAGAGFGGAARGSPNAGDHVLLDAVSALVNLGYGRAEAHQVTAIIISSLDDPSLEVVLPEALKRLAEGVRR